jgi:iron complex outermembrane receptor protein
MRRNRLCTQRVGSRYKSGRGGRELFLARKDGEREDAADRKRIPGSLVRPEKLSWLLSVACLIASGAFAAEAADSTGSVVPGPPSTDASEVRQGDIQEIVVTARKRTETLISAPVVISAVGSAELDRRGINNLDDIAEIVPELIIGPGAGGVQGGSIALRGLAGPDDNAFGDQAVAFNIDGVQVAKSSVRRISDTDVEQVEVLKGPQALFFGKNSPGGVVSIQSKDPTDHFEAGLKTGYEFDARETRTEGYVSGPLAEGLTGRFAGYFSSMQGWLTDVTPKSSIYTPSDGRNPDTTDYFGRATLKWDPDDRLDAKLKLSYGQTRTNGQAPTEEFISCPLGARQYGSGLPCGVGSRNTNPGAGPYVGTIPATVDDFGDGQNYLLQKQALGGLEVNYHLSNDLTLTSVTGYYYSDLHDMQQYTGDVVIILPAAVEYTDKEFSQELRLVSSFSGPLNFVAGGYFADTSAVYGSAAYLYGGNFDLFGPGVAGPTTPDLISDVLIEQRGQAYSGFMQMIYQPFDKIEFDAGGRYSHEQKHIPVVDNNPTSPIINNSPVTGLPVTRADWTNLSPEVTISWRPSTDLTVFTSYKQGFLSGGFNANPTDFSVKPDLSYRPETVEGFEAGVKSRMLNGALHMNVAVYTYNITDLQLVNYQNAISILRNAGAARTQGVEEDLSFRTPLEGLSLTSAAAYNRGLYTKYQNATCYQGQSPAEGCTFQNGAPVQDLSGTELPRAPKWNINGGYTYEHSLGSGLIIGVSSDADFSSSYLTDATSAPQGRMPQYTLVDSTIRVGDQNEKWELALIGRNLTNRYVWVNSGDAPFTGSGTGTPAAVRADTFAVVGRGREIMLRASYKF